MAARSMWWPAKRSVGGKSINGMVWARGREHRL
jgi:choline dehydrogenase-like flavoprotein